MKPIIAYISGNGCSAAYWAASAATKIVANPTSIIGSIGVMCQFVVDGQKTIDVVSSISPKKTIDVTSEEGKAQIQAHVDALAQIFVRAIARNRALGEVQILERFGQGDVFVGVEAVSRGMADVVGNMQDAINLINSQEQKIQPERKAESMQIKKKFNLKSLAPQSALVVVDDTGLEIPEGTPIEEIDADWVKSNLPEVAQALIDEGKAAQNQANDELAQVDVNPDDMAEKAIFDQGRASGLGAAKIALAIMAHRKKTGQVELARIKAKHDADAAAIPGVTPPEDPEAAEMALFLASAHKGMGKRGK